MSGNLETLAFFHVTTCGGFEGKVYAGSELKAVRRAFPKLDAEFFIVKKLTYASGGKVSDPDLQLVRGPSWPKDGSGDERVYNMMHPADEERMPTLAELAQEEQERRQLDEDFANASHNSQVQEFDATVAMQAGMTELDRLNDEEACRMMNEEDASEYLATVR